MTYLEIKNILYTYLYSQQLDDFEESLPVLCNIDNSLFVAFLFFSTYRDGMTNYAILEYLVGINLYSGKVKKIYNYDISKYFIINTIKYKNYEGKYDKDTYIERFKSLIDSGGGIENKIKLFNLYQSIPDILGDDCFKNCYKPIIFKGGTYENYRR